MNGRIDPSSALTVVDGISAPASSGQQSLQRLQSDPGTDDDLGSTGSLADRPCGGMTRGLNAVVAEVLRVFSGLKSAIKSMVLFVLSAVVAYRLLDIGMDLRAEGAVAFGSWPQQ